MNKHALRISIIIIIVITCCILLKADVLFSEANNKSMVRPGLGKICLDCHKALKKDLLEGKAHSPSKTGECIACHNPHAARYGDLLTTNEDQLCYSCHEAQKIGAQKKVKHDPVEFGQCMSCHKPHISQYSNLLKEKGEGLCYLCHDKSSYNKLYVHSPVNKSVCGGCHKSHSSDFPNLLDKPVPGICHKCHLSVSGHEEMDNKNVDCVQCHTPHSSEKADLLYSISHEPYAKGRCEECHQKISGTIQKGPGNAALCFKCHKDAEKRFNEKKNSHIVKGLRECTFCHNPHGSEREDLVRGKDRPLCISCHKEIGIRLKREKDMIRHPEVIAGRCSTCHDSHASDDPRFLKEDINGLCLACHERQQVFCHPIGDKALDPRTKTPIVCITCHNPMGTRHSYILKLSGEEALCKQCHKNY